MKKFVVTACLLFVMIMAASAQSDLKQDMKDVGKDLKKTTKKIGKTTKKVGKEVGKESKKFGKEVGKESKKIGKGAKRATKSTKKAIKSGSRKFPTKGKGLSTAAESRLIHEILCIALN